MVSRTPPNLSFKIKKLMSFVVNRALSKKIGEGLELLTASSSSNEAGLW